ncbi:MAG: Na/Pi cotransporter family protein [Desulfocapsaceae bacterium]
MLHIKFNLKLPIYVASFGVIATLLILSSNAFGADSSGNNIDFLKLFMGLFGGLALFLAGLDLLSDGLKKAAGETLKVLLSKMTTNRFLGAITGAFVTAVLNSSSVTTVLVVSFITAGVMTLSQSVGVIMGANIGSTMTAQLLAFNISAYSLIPIAIGFFMTFVAKRDNVKHVGMMLMGLGLVFYGMSVMSEAMTPLRSYEPFMVFLQKMERPLLGILAGAIFTGLVQSSAATVGIAIAMATEGLLSLEAGIALALGANIGTCVTALLAALGKPVEAVRAAIVHILFNIIGVIVWLPFIPILADLAIAVSPVKEGVEGVAKMASDIPRQIANANTIFNVINTIVFISFTGLFAKAAVKLYPDRKEKTGVIIEPKYLDEAAIELPSVAFEQVRQEFGRMGGIASRMFSELPEAVVNKNREGIDRIIKLDDQVDILEAAIFKYLSKVRQLPLSEEESKTHQNLMTATVSLENLADLVETEISGVVKRFIEKERQVSETTKKIFTDLYEEVQKSIELAVLSVQKNDQNAAIEVFNKKETIEELIESLMVRKAESLGRDKAAELETARLEISLFDKMARTYTLARRIAKITVPPEIRGG